MNLIPIIKADILKTDANFLLHGCNCQASMSGGLARFIAKKWPEVEKRDLATLEVIGSNNMLGDFSIQEVTSDSGKPLCVVNLYTQFYPGPDFRLASLESSIKAFLKILDPGEPTFALPKIGCGIGGGEWYEVYPLLCKLFDGYKALIYTVD